MPDQTISLPLKEALPSLSMPILLWRADWLQDHYYYDRVIDQGVYCVYP